MSASVFADLGRETQRYWLCRLFLTLIVLLNCWTILTEPQALIAIVIRETGPLGRPFIFGLAGLAVLGIVDVFVNDMLPARCVLPWAAQVRHVIYLAMAMALTALASVIYQFSPFSPLIWVTYLTYAAFAASIAWLDLFSRPRGNP